MKRIRQLALVALTFCVWCIGTMPGEAQARLRVLPGDAVTVVDNAGGKTTGTVLAIEADAVRLKVDGVEQIRKNEDIREVWWLHDSLRNGFAWGAAAGTGLGLLAGNELGKRATDEGRNGVSSYVVMMGVGFGAGCALGTVIDAMIHGRTLAYRAPSAKLTLAPLAAPHSRGLLVAMRF